MNEEEKNYNQMRNDFLINLRNKCFPLLNSMETRRKRLQTVFKILLPIAAIFFILFILSFIITPNTTNSTVVATINDPQFYSFVFNFLFDFFAPIAFIISGGIFMAYCFYNKRFVNDVKKQVMPVLCNVIGNIEWKLNPFISHDLYVNSYILDTRFDKVEIDDTFVGNYKDVQYNIVEAHYQKKEIVHSKEGNRTKYVTVFDGLLITLDMNKKFKSHTVIKPNIVGRFKATRDLKHTTLEDVEFEKKFDVLTNDEVEARYLITPSFMERLNNIQMSFMAPSIECAFYQDKLIIAMNSLPDMFQVGSIWKPLTDESQYFKMFEEVYSIIKLIDHFRLDQKIGL